MMAKMARRVGEIAMYTFERRSFALFRFVGFLTFLTLSIAQGVPQMPKTEGESFAGHGCITRCRRRQGGCPCLWIYQGFQSPDECMGRLADFGTRPDFVLYQLPVLEDVPRLFRGVVISGIKKGVPQNKRDHFVPILQGEAELKKFVHYNEPDDAYLAVLSRAGNILELSHGSPGDANYARLRAEIESVRSRNEDRDGHYNSRTWWLWQSGWMASCSWCRNSRP